MRALTQGAGRDNTGHVLEEGRLDKRSKAILCTGFGRSVCSPLRRVGREGRGGTTSPPPSGEVLEFSQRLLWADLVEGVLAASHEVLLPPALGLAELLKEVLEVTHAQRPQDALHTERERDGGGREVEFVRGRKGTQREGTDHIQYAADSSPSGSPYTRRSSGRRYNRRLCSQCSSPIITEDDKGKEISR